MHSRAVPAVGTLEIVLLFYLLFFVVECYVNMNVFVGNSRFLREFTEAMVLNFCSTFKNNRQRDETDIMVDSLSRRLRYDDVFILKLAWENVW